MFDTIFQDLRFALRGLRRSPAFTLVAVGSLALGIGANTAIFSFVNAILLKHLPVPSPEQLTRISEVQGSKEINSVFSYPFIDQLNKQSEFFQSVAGRFPVRVNLASDTASEPLHGEVVTGAYFRTLQVQPALGRLLTEYDISAAPGNPVCVLSYAAWQGRFAGDPQIIGRTLILNMQPYRVIGVTQRGFFGAQLHSRVDMQLPISRMGDFMGGFFSSFKGRTMWNSPGFSWLEPLARLKPGVSRARAQAALEPLAQAIKLQLGDAKNREKVRQDKTAFRLLSASQGANYDSSRRDPLLVLMGVVGLILLIACLNLANLLLAKAKTREKEWAVRLSLGAGRGRLMRQLFTESLAIGLLGGTLGLLFAGWLTKVLLLYFNGHRTDGGDLQVRLDPAVLCFALALSFLTAMLFGLAPAWQSARVDFLPSLKAAQNQHSASRNSASLRKLLTVFQLAFSVCLLFGAGLLAGTLRHLQTIDLGFQPAQVIALSIDPAMAGYKLDQIDRAFDEIVNRLKSDRSVTAASYAVVSPLEGSMISLSIEVPGHEKKSSDPQIDFNMISPAYFTTLRQPLLAGRDFSARDTKKAPAVAIVNQLFVEDYLPGVNPIGRHLKVNSDEVEIVGLTANSRYQQMRETPIPLVYLPTAQTQSSGYTLLVRTRGNRSAISEIEQTIRSVNRKIPVYNVRTLQDDIDRGLSSERILSLLSQLFGGLAMLLCAIGIYGIVAYGVTSRTREIGVRFALGATRAGIAKLFLRDALLLLATGIALGVPLALATAHLFESLLFGLRPNDPSTLLTIVAIFCLVSLSATLLPVRRAASVEPQEALRHE